MARFLSARAIVISTAPKLWLTHRLVNPPEYVVPEDRQRPHYLRLSGGYDPDDSSDHAANRYLFLDHDCQTAESTSGELLPNRATVFRTR